MRFAIAGLAAGLLLAPLASGAMAQSHPRDGEIRDADTRAWWHAVEALSGDDLEGRDTGSPGYDRAAVLVAERFRAAGLKPAGDNGSYFQEIALREVAVAKVGTSFAVVRDSGGEVPLTFLHQISVRAARDLPATLDAPLAFRGFCAAKAWGEIKGRIAVDTQRGGWQRGRGNYGNGWGGDYRGWNNSMRGYDSGSFKCKIERGRVVDLDIDGIRGL